MTATSHWRGHPIYWDGERWRYSDNDQPTVGNERNCGECGKARTPQGHDGCLGTLPGVTNACCGHGRQAEAYVQFATGGELRGTHAAQFLKSRKARSTIRKTLKPKIIRAFQITAPVFRNTIAFQGLVLFAASFTGGIHLAIGNDGRALFQVLLAAGVYAFIVVTTTDWWGIDGD